jgi:uncharacterized protein
VQLCCLTQQITQAIAKELAMKTNLEIIREFYETLDLELVDPDVDENVADGCSMNGYYRGRQAVQEWIAKLTARFDNWKDVPDRLIDLGDLVIALGNYQGRSQVTGKTFDVPFSHIWFLKDGRISKLNYHVDTFVLDRAIAPDNALQN